MDPAFRLGAILGGGEAAQVGGDFRERDVAKPLRLPDFQQRAAAGQLAAIPEEARDKKVVSRDRHGFKSPCEKDARNVMCRHRPGPAAGLPAGRWWARQERPPHRQSRRSLGNPRRERDNVSHLRVPPIALKPVQAKGVFRAVGGRSQSAAIWGQGLPAALFRMSAFIGWMRGGPREGTLPIQQFSFEWLHKG